MPQKITNSRPSYSHVPNINNLEERANFHSHHAINQEKEPMKDWIRLKAEASNPNFVPKSKSHKQPRGPYWPRGTGIRKRKPVRKQKSRK